MTDFDDAPLYPLLGFSAGVIDGAVAFRVDFATSPNEYASHEGQTQSFVMTAAAAIEIGEALIERGALAGGGSRA